MSAPVDSHKAAKSKADGKDRFPINVRCDSAVVKVYRTGDDHFTVAWRRAGRRVRASRNTLNAAKKFAGEKARELADGKHDIMELRAADRERFLSALSSLADTGLSLDVACKEFAEAWRLVKPASLIQVARWWKEHHSHDLPEKAIAEIAEEFLKDRGEAGVCGEHMGNLRRCLGWFTSRFPGQIKGVSAAMIEDALRSLKCAPATWNDRRRIIVSLFNFARRRGYLFKDRKTEASAVKTLKDMGKDISTFGPAEISALLDAAAKVEPDTVPYLAVGAFCGVRGAEIARLAWEDFRWDRGVIDVAKHKAKTRARRLVPISPNLAAWLAPYRGCTGSVVQSVTIPRRAIALAKRIGLTWGHNVLRDSFISYRLAQTQDISRTSLEAGNSPNIIRQHYLELKTPAEATAWFGVMPGGATNVVPFAAAAG